MHHTPCCHSLPLVPSPSLVRQQPAMKAAATIIDHCWIMAMYFRNGAALHKKPKPPPPPPASSSVALRLQTQAPMDMGINLLRARRTTSFEIALDIARHDQLRKYGPVPRAVSEGAYLLGHYARKVRVLEVQFFLTSMRVGQGSCFAIDGGGGVAAMRRGGGSRCENEKGATTFSSAIGRVIKMSKSHSTHEHNI